MCYCSMVIIWPEECWFQQVHPSTLMAVQNIKVYVNVTHQGQGLPKHASGPFPSGYVPKLDMSAELNDKDSSFYQ
jgi:hypothetical protein